MMNHMCIHSVICAELRDKCPKNCRQIQYGADITAIKRYFEDHKGVPLPYNASVVYGESHLFEVTL
jgi:hypothetical protein